VIQIKNAAFLRTLYDGKLVEALESLATQVSNVQQQTNANGTGSPQAPAAIGGLKVTGQNGHFNIAITDNSPIFRDVHYWVEHADNQHFLNPHVVHMGQSRNHNLFLGNVTRYFRAFSSYSSSPPSQAVYHNNPQGRPMAVQGGGTVGGPLFTEAQSSGTGAPGQGLQGPGVAPFRSTTGAPPSR
jgi:hypothetical protein